MPANLDAALRYVTGDSPLGVPVGVLAVNHNKLPAHKWGGDHAAWTPDEVEQLFAQHPDKLVGVILRDTRIAVVDIEGEGHGFVLEEVLARVEATLGDLPPTLTATTAGGGIHLYYEVPEGIDIDAFPDDLMPGVELKRGSRRTNGRYVLAPMSLDGEEVAGRRFSSLLPVAPLPEVLHPSGPAPRPTQGLSELQFSEGSRNKALFSAGATMRNAGITGSALEAALVAVNRQLCDPPLSDEEVVRTAASLNTRGAKAELVAPVEELGGDYGTPIDEAVVGGLPLKLRKMVRGVSTARAFPLEATTLMALAALGGACGGMARVQPYPATNPDWTEPLGFSCAVIMASGTGKSGPRGDLTAGLSTYDRTCREAQANAVLAAKAEVEALELRAKKLRGDVAKGGDPNAQAELVKCMQHLDDAKREAMGPSPVLAGTSPNTEGIVKFLGRHGRGLIAADESTGVDAVLGMYSGQSNTGDLNNAIDESRIQTLRADDTRVVAVERPSLSMMFALQPSVLRQLRGDERANTNGFTPRFSWCVPADPGQSTPGADRVGVPVEVRAAWDDLLGQLCALRDAYYDKDQPASASRLLTLHAPAAEAFEQWERTVRARELEAPTMTMRSWRAKNPGRCLTVAGLLHCARHGADAMAKQVSAEDVQLAIALVELLDDHALVALAGSGPLDSEASPATLLALRIQKWAEGRTDPARPFTSSEVRMQVLDDGERRRSVGGKTAAEQVADAMQALGRTERFVVVETKSGSNTVLEATPIQ